MPRDLLVAIFIFALAGIEFECAGQNAGASRQTIEPIPSSAEFDQKGLLEDYSIRVQEQIEARDKRIQEHYAATTCYRSDVIPGVAYRCMKSDDYQILEPPFPLAIPQRFNWKASNGFDLDRDLGFVPVADTKDGAKTVDEWFEKARTSPELRCNQVRCLDLVAFIAATQRPGHAKRWLSVCSRYKVGTGDSLPLDCMAIAAVFEAKTWVLVPGQCNGCGGELEPEVFITCGAPDSAFLRAVQSELQADPWRLQTRLLKDSIVASSPASRARFVSGWEKMSIRLDVADEGSILEMMYLLFDPYNTTKFAENRQYSEIYETHLKQAATHACREACANTGGIPIIRDSSTVNCNPRAGDKGIGHGHLETPPYPSSSPFDVPTEVGPLKSNSKTPSPPKKTDKPEVIPMVPPSGP